MKSSGHLPNLRCSVDASPPGQVHAYMSRGYLRSEHVHPCQPAGYLASFLPGIVLQQRVGRYRVPVRSSVPPFPQQSYRDIGPLGNIRGWTVGHGRTPPKTTLSYHPCVGQGHVATNRSCACGPTEWGVGWTGADEL